MFPCNLHFIRKQSYSAPGQVKHFHIYIFSRFKGIVYIGEVLKWVGIKRELKSIFTALNTGSGNNNSI